MWVHLSGERERRTIVYDYQENRKGENAVPILEVIKKLLEEVKDAIAPQSIVGKAVGCTLNNWQGLNNYLLDGRLRIDNNDSEHSIKPFAVGRKNWMFCVTTKGTKASANIYSIIETFKANKINLYDYLKYLLNHIHDYSDPKKLINLLSYNIDKKLLSN